MPEGPAGGSAGRSSGKRPLSGSGGVKDDDSGDERSPAPAQHAPAPAPLDFGTYMAVKSTKLRVQFDEQRAEKRRRLGGATNSGGGGEPSTFSASMSNIFSGVVIHVNGLTVPSALVCYRENVEGKLWA